MTVVGRLMRLCSGLVLLGLSVSAAATTLNVAPVRVALAPGETSATVQVHNSGDRIAIMQGGWIVQIGTPEEIVRAPANEYVRSFFRGVDVSQVFTAGDIARRDQLTVIERAGVSLRAALSRLAGMPIAAAAETVSG